MGSGFLNSYRRRCSLLYSGAQTGDSFLVKPKYDFNWQLGYELEKPIVLPRGTRIECTAHFDNSINNPHNPDPEKLVTWGDQTSQEMMVGFFDVAVPAGMGKEQFFVRKN